MQLPDPMEDAVTRGVITSEYCGGGSSTALWWYHRRYRRHVVVDDYVAVL
jgi:hypothetical protein